MSNLWDQALRYAAWGWYVFPLLPFDAAGRCACGAADCGRVGKHPAVKWGSKATRDPKQIERWRRWLPNAGLGVACGPSKLVVVDIDGPNSEAELLAIFGGRAPPATLQVRTGKGRHLYFTGKSKTVSREGDAIDIRAAGGFVVVPPSKHVSGMAYTWDAVALPVPLPPEISAWRESLGGKSKKTKQTAALVAPSYAKGSAPLAMRALGQSIDRVEVLEALAWIPASCGREPWWKVGMALHATGWPDAFAIWDWWSSTCAEKYKPDNTAYVWSTFKPGDIAIGMLFIIAREYGWNRDATPTALGVSQAPRSSELGAAATPAFASTTNGVHALPATVLQLTEPIIFPDKSKNKLLATCRNTRVAIRAIGLQCEHDTFHDKLRIGGQAIAEWAGDLSDNAVHMLRVIIEQQFHFDPGTVNAHDAAVQECLQNGFDPVQDYLDDLVWDGQPRIDQWMAAYLGAEASPFNSAVSCLFLLAAVRRARVPGCKFDQVVVFEGPEGRGKSSALEILAGTENFSDQTILTLDDKGQQEAVQGVWIYEMADFAGHGKAENERTKALLSRTHDRARPAYGRSRVDRPRRCVFGATTNESTYLKSQTGNRRFWPALCGRIDLDSLARDRDQLWAEAAYRERGAQLILPESMWKDAGVLQDSRRDVDPWDDMLDGLEKYAKTQTTNKKGETTLFVAPDGWHLEQRITSRDVMEMVLKLPVERLNDVTAKRVAFAMRRAGWDGPKVVRFDQATFKGYTKLTDKRVNG